MVLQASGARTVMDNEPERAATAMRVVEDTGTQAMAELRRLLNVLRTDGDDAAVRQPTPLGLSALPDLVESVEAAGILVSLHTVGAERPLDASVDAAAYRVISESLTNITKHSGPGTSAEVLLHWSSDHLDIDVRDDGGGSGSDPRLSTGNGLLGLTERIVLVGGDFEAHPVPTGGYEVHATLPISTVESARPEVLAR
jgi:signal transduction histidine kinase